MTQLGLLEGAGPPEAAALLEELAKDDRRRADLAKRAPRGFDPACLFLLELHPENLYDSTTSPEWFTCRGCGATVGRRDRQRHHANHKRRTK